MGPLQISSQHPSQTLQADGPKVSNEKDSHQAFLSNSFFLHAASPERFGERFSLGKVFHVFTSRGLIGFRVWQIRVRKGFIHKQAEQRASLSLFIATFVLSLTEDIISMSTHSISFWLYNIRQYFRVLASPYLLNILSANKILTIIPLFRTAYYFSSR